jgi:hypothetical protein
MSASLLLAQGGHEHVVDVGFSIGSLALRVILLVAVPVVAAFAFLRGFLGEPSRFATVAVAMAAATAATMELLLSGRVNLPEQVIPLLLAAIALPIYLVLSKDERFARVVGRGLRIAPLVFAVAAVLAGTQFALALSADRDRATTLLHTGVLLGLVALVWFAIARPSGRVGTVGTRAAAAVLGVALLAATAQAITMRPADPVPGVATRARLEVGGTGVDVLVVPNLPGWNLVHVSIAAVSVGAGAGDLVPARPVAGTPGGWAAVELPAGRGDVRVEDLGGTGSFTTDTGASGSAPEEFGGADGPECASAALGRMLGSGTAAGVRCPSEQLDPPDADALRSMVDLLAGQGQRRIAVAGDQSPRGIAAAAVVRAAAAARHVTLVEPGTAEVPLVLVGGWAEAGDRLRLVADGDLPAQGTYLAPWLFGGPAQAVHADQRVAARFAVSDESFQRYRAALRGEYPGQAPSAAGYRAWLAQQGLAESGPVRMLRPSTAE